MPHFGTSVKARPGVKLVRSPQVKVTGSYQLESYDGNLELWLEALGINGAEFGPVFRKTKVKIFVREPSKHNKRWSLSHKEEGENNPEKAISYVFEPGKSVNIEDILPSESESLSRKSSSSSLNSVTATPRPSARSRSYSRSTSRVTPTTKTIRGQKVVCHNTDSRSIVCTSEVKSHQWSIDSHVVFTAEGITAKYRVGDVTLTAKYTRMVDPWAAKKRKLLRARNFGS